MPNATNARGIVCVMVGAKITAKNVGRTS